MLGGAVGKIGFPVQVTRHGEGGALSIVRVDCPLEKFGLPSMRIMASGNKAPLVEASYLPEGLGWSLDDRLRNEGARKGRVIAVWKGEQLVGACAWHLHESGPPVIFDLGCRIDLPEKIAARVRIVLIGCLRDIAEDPSLHRASDSLRWTDIPTKRIPVRKDRGCALGELLEQSVELLNTLILSSCSLRRSLRALLIDGLKIALGPSRHQVDKPTQELICPLLAMFIHPTRRRIAAKVRLGGRQPRPDIGITL
jgi:hypothetical protein